MAENSHESRHVVVDSIRLACQQWLDTLDGEQRVMAWFRGPEGIAVPDRTRWFYTPTHHGGIPMSDQRADQQQLVMKLLSTALSERAYVTASMIIGMENVLDRLEGWSRKFDRVRGRDPGSYWLRVFGDPGQGCWGWRFGGHHLSLNFLFDTHNVIATTPSFFGSDPARAPLFGDAWVRPLGGLEDPARSLVRSMRPAQQRRAIVLDRAPADIVGGNRPQLTGSAQMMRVDNPSLWGLEAFDPKTEDMLRGIADMADKASGLTPDAHAAIAINAEPIGVPAELLDEDQRQLLRTLIASYRERVRPELWVGPTDFPLDGVHFAWAGAQDDGEPHYYRIHGPRLLIEYDNTQRSANHAHSVWRDPVGDFGLDVLREHRHDHHQH